VLIGATRKTLYNWFFGGFVIPAYRERVTKVYEILKTSPDRDVALKRACAAFDVRL
jgi:hypothetical protein